MRNSELTRRVLSLVQTLMEAVEPKLRGLQDVSQFPRDIERLIAFGLEVPVVRAPRLTLHGAVHYLCVLGGEELREGFEARADATERNLLGLLHVGPPCNLIFVRADLPEHIRNFVLAHELGHFFAEVFLLQQLWARSLPERVGAIERAFAWQEHDSYLELQALVKGLPERPKTIVGRGGHLTEGTTAREITADSFARELMAPWEQVVPLIRPGDRRGSVEVLHHQFGLPLRVAAGYADELERHLQPKRDALDKMFAPWLNPAAEH